MAQERIQRELTTIFAADVERYSRLMRADEEATLNTPGEYHKIINALILRHDGRVSQGFLLRGCHPVSQFATGYGFNRNGATLPS